MNLQKICMKFNHLMQKGNVNVALRLMINNMSNGILQLIDETLHLLHTKHAEMQNSHEEVLLQGPIKEIHPVVYKANSETLISKVASKAKCGCGPSECDPENWLRILVSKSFAFSSLDLRKFFANLTRILCTKNFNTLINAVGNCLIPLNKNPWIRPIGVGGVIHRIAGKFIMAIAKKVVQETPGSLQVCSGQDAGAEAANHAM